ncbi:Asp-tRNA(Asn)/Glu-tRNA(Gln) amidotransferase subunit GatB [Candidatus Woesearchaeota archaeon]|nr:Asp-tRNA(Asn)/Glu-tRNA(Gln) amidotransferase subunit GatB [Candidatus Woesearchaeota archaeon]
MVDALIGMEVHVQLNTNTKLFCRCPTLSGIPNTKTCPTCLGHPGSKPVLNKRAFHYAIKFALALNCSIAQSLVFSRKTYFYPDMSKNYQITQYELPLAVNGKVVLDSGKEIRIKRLHIEEDPAGLVHEEISLVDYNRSGIPLVEVVSEPDISSAEEARDFMKKLMSILNYLDIFDASSGVIKADVNVSVKKNNFERVEIKNVTGFKEIERAIEYEIHRQNNEQVVRETRSWNADLGKTFSLRKKETEEDYGYITEPDIIVRQIPKLVIDKLSQEIPELPAQKAERWVKNFKIDSVDARIIASDPQVASLYEEVAFQCDKILSARWVRRELLRVLNTAGVKLSDTALKAYHLIPLFKLLERKEITDRTGQQLIRELAQSPFDVGLRVKNDGLSAVGDVSEIGKLVDLVLDENVQALQDYRKGEQKAFEFLVGQIMKKAKGRAKPDVVRTLLLEKA